MAVDDTLIERGARYGDFADHAMIAQRLQDVMHTIPSDWGWSKLNDVQKQALTVIADKIARILSGDPNYADNWHDIQGYARLVEERLDPDFDFEAVYAASVTVEKIFDKPTGQVKLVKSCCRHPNPNSVKEGASFPAHSYCLNCGHRYKPGEIQDVGNQT